jgi:very-short-patch-repair endonuclease
MPGWPVEVPLPFDDQWKRDFAGSVQRLIRDGLDLPLARLFAGAAGMARPTGEGAERARSASEAFLFRRLQTLRETRDRFHLNAELPIAFDNEGKMEVDFLCPEAKLVIELDGAQHLADPEAYRRDRRKDALLQRHGYFVLRFLAEDAGKNLETILDLVMAVLAQRDRIGVG